jgi:hypothetical protein
MSTAAGQKVTVNETSSTSVAAVTTGENVLVPGDDQWNDHHGHPGHRATDRQRVDHVLGGGGGPLPTGCTEHSQAGQSFTVAGAD